jgi:NAD(P)-dependent dehydrogenase (short-subunit alcohol dehydrogenase family)
MQGLLVVGGSRGIGKAIIQKSLNTRAIHNLSRNPVDIEGVQHHSLDVLQDALPSVEDINSLVYCPGSINLKPISSLKVEDFRQDLEINLIGAVKAIKHYHKGLKKAENASIVLFSTVAVAQGMPFHASVAAAKAAIEGLTKSLAAEFAPKIRVNCIAPTITNTPLAAGILRSEEAIEKVKLRHPTKDILSAEEVAALACYLMSPEAKGITGQIFHIDGGLSTLKI